MGRSGRATDRVRAIALERDLAFAQGQQRRFSQSEINPVSISKYLATQHASLYRKHYAGFTGLLPSIFTRSSRKCTSCRAPISCLPRHRVGASMSALSVPVTKRRRTAHPSEVLHRPRIEPIRSALTPSAKLLDRQMDRGYSCGRALCRVCSLVDDLDGHPAPLWALLD